jgi:hypothetical protein
MKFSHPTDIVCSFKVRQTSTWLVVFQQEKHYTVVAKGFENVTREFPQSFAASVSLDIFVRCYYGILKFNYKHFISVKGFY